ncbi:hypothetical protein ACJX0J_005854 [Zea mays]
MFLGQDRLRTTRSLFIAVSWKKIKFSDTLDFFIQNCLIMFRQPKETKKNMLKTFYPRLLTVYILMHAIATTQGLKGFWKGNFKATAQMTNALDQLELGTQRTYFHIYVGARYTLDLPNFT